MDNGWDEYCWWCTNDTEKLLRLREGHGLVLIRVAHLHGHDASR
jgi:hypothetical protein